jgi:hypothetical protein
MPAAFLVCQILLPGMGGATDIEKRPTTLGISLAYPKSAGVKAPMKVVADIEFGVAADGTVSTVKGRIPEDSVYLRLLDSALQRVEFVPGQIDSANAPQIIPAELTLFRNSTRALLRTPVTDSGRLGDPNLYLAGLRANNVTPPVLKYLAPVFCPHPKNDSLSDLPYALLRIDLNAAGRPTRVDSTRSTLGGITDQIISAFNWADFAPAKSGAFYVPSTVYAVVIYHPRARYPTRRIGMASNDTAGTLEQYLIRLVTNLDGVMIPPLPTSLNADSIVLSRAAGKSYGMVSLWCSFDTLGQVWPNRFSSSNSTILSICQEAITEFRFHPATDFKGRRVPFSGLIYFDFAGSGNVRVYLDWLRRPGSRPMR